jgi:hypothetical protein
MAADTWIPTYEEYDEAIDLDDWHKRIVLIRERNELREQLAAAMSLMRIIVGHERCPDT